MRRHLATLCGLLAALALFAIMVLTLVDVSGRKLLWLDGDARSSLPQKSFTQRSDHGASLLTVGFHTTVPLSS